jgi:hypothetical protein
MKLRGLFLLLKWPVTLALLGGLFALAYHINVKMQAERAREAESDKVQSPKRVKDNLVNLEEDVVEVYGIETQPAEAVSWTERIPVYGRVIPNPRATVEVRSPFAGRLRADAKAAWPTPGQWVRSGQILGWLEVRLGPQERLDLQTKLNDARIKRQGAEDILAIHHQRVERLKRSSASEIVSGRELDEAVVQLTEARTQQATAQAAVELWQKAVDVVNGQHDRRGGPWSQPLTAPADGHVTELAGRPGMVVESGALVAQLVDFRRPLIQLDLAPELVATGLPKQVSLLALPVNPPARRGLLSSPEPVDGFYPVEAQLAGPAPRLDVASQFASYWYEVRLDPSQGADAKTTDSRTEGTDRLGALWRPGLQVRAYVPVPDAPPKEAVAVPATAVLFHQGRACLYVCLTPTKYERRYERREVSLLGREGDRWLLGRRQGKAPSGVAPNEAVVYRQAQVLLSEEFRGDVDND